MAIDAMQAMDRQYRYQRYIYDFSRKYYLLGRDTLLQGMAVQAGEQIVEVGCGTGRNLLRLAYRFPNAQLYGMDASNLMLATAQEKLNAKHYGDKVCLRQGLAQQLQAVDFGIESGFDHILFSYVLSMIPDWQDAVQQALHQLRPGGYLHIVDFSDQQSLPTWARKALLTWLDWFNVHPDSGVPAYLEQLAQVRQDQLNLTHLSGRYALVAHYRKRGTHYDDLSALAQIPQYLDF